MFFSSNQQLVDFLERKGFIRSLQVKEAFLVVDRKKFVPEKFQEFVYYDQPIFIASGQTISQPATVAIMLELLGTQPGDKVLDIGAGSGWVSCLLSHLIGEAGKVYAYELNKKVGAFGKEVISNSNFENINYVVDDASRYWSNKGPFDRIYAGAAFEKIPLGLISQLKEGGILVAPTQQNDLRKITKIQNKFQERIYSGFAFVPFIDSENGSLS